MHSLSSPTKSPVAQVVQEGLRRSLAKPVKFTVETLDVIASEAVGGNSLGDIHLTAAFLLAFAGFLRYDEVSSIWPCDIKFEPEHITIYIPRSGVGRYGIFHPGIWY